jgi:hypothetical protein
MEPKTILDLGMKIRVAYNHDPGLVSGLAEYGDFVDSVYFTSNINIFPSAGSPFISGIDWNSYDEELKRNIGFLLARGIKSYLLLNATSFDPNIVKNYETSRLRNYLKMLVNETGLRNVVIFNLALASKIKKDFPEVGIEVSLNAAVDSLEKAKFWKEQVDIDAICVHHRLNKRPRTLRLIREKAGVRITIIANNPCLIECPNEISHNNFCSYRGNEVTYFGCSGILSARPWDVFHQAKVVPANLKHLKGAVDIIKLEGRADRTDDVLKQVVHYATHLDSYRYTDNCVPPLFPLYHPYRLNIEPPEAFEKVSACARNCDECGYCRKLWKSYYGFPDEMELCVNGYAMFSREKYQEAIECFEKYKATGKETDWDFYYHLGMCYKAVSEYKKAIESFKEALRLKPDEWAFLNILGVTFREAGDYAAAVEILKKAIDIRPREWRNYNILGNVYMKLGERGKAVVMFENALSLNPPNDYAEKIKKSISSAREGSAAVDTAG